MDLRHALLALATLLSLGCGAETADDGTTADDDLRAARCETKYAAPLRAKVAAARARIADSKVKFAVELRDALDQGKVKVLPFCAVTPEDFEHVADDTDLTAGGATREEQYRSLREGNEALMRSVHSQIYGYQWGDRIYIASTMRENGTLETLAHETQHVLRQAHLRNFKDQRVTCVEELAAARAERLVKKDVLPDAEERELMDRVHDLYELDKLAPGKCTYR